MSKPNLISTLEQRKEPWNVNIIEKEGNEQGKLKRSIDICGNPKTWRNSPLQWGLQRSLMKMI